MDTHNRETAAEKETAKEERTDHPHDAETSGEKESKAEEHADHPHDSHR